MPPKKDDKKGAKGAKAPKKEIDLTEYQRPTVGLPDVATSEAGALPELSGRINNIETLFPEWEVTGEVWTEVLTPEAVPEISFPAHIAVTEYKPLRSYLGLDSEGEAVSADPKKAAAKKDAGKKGAAASSAEMEEPAADESGRPLPRMVLQAGGDEVSASTSTTGFTHTTSFRRHWTCEQKDLKAQLAVMQEALTTSAEDDDKAKAQALLDEFLAAHKDSLSTPAGPEIDPFMCAALRLVTRFAPPVVATNLLAEETQTSSSSSLPYLWRAIYPQLASGRPCYNPSSKYCVRIFLAGKWRKVVVTDTVPVDSDGLPSLATSANPLELWPLILSKAVYATYTACGYNCSLESVSGIHVNHFLGFALHVLTGWQPSTPWHVGTTIADTSRLSRFLDDMKSSGALSLLTEEIPGPIPTATVVSAENKVDGGKTKELRTKKFYEDEYRRRAQEREALVQQIADRESKIVTIEERLKAPFGECFVACCSDPESSSGELLVMPILGIDFGVPESTQPAAVRLLVEWTTSPAPPLPTAVQLSPEEAAKETLLDKMRREAPPLPPSTILKMRWVSVQFLVDNDGFVSSLDTAVRNPNKAVLGWHWRAPEVAVDPKAKDAKGKGKDVAVAPAASEPCVYPGTLPPVFLKLIGPSFFLPVDEPAPLPLQASPDVEGQTPLDAEAEAEAQAAVNAQAEQLELLSPKPTILKPASTHLSLTVMIHADMPADAPYSIPTEGVVVVLQEIRPHGEEPLVMRVELSALAGVPITRTTFRIPADRVNATEPMLFWVRMFTQASVYLSFSCGVEISVGEAHSIWQSLGRSVLVREGEASPTLPETEQMLFRIPLQLQESSDGDVEDVALSFVHITNRSISNCVATVLLGDGKASQTEQAYFLPRLEANNIPVSSSVPRLLVGRVFPSSSCPLLSSGVPPFAWKATILSRKPLVEPIAAVQVGAVTSRYSGKYRPNHNLLIFRDILAVDKNSFPAALRITLNELNRASNSTPEGVPEPSEDETLGLNESICIVLRTYRKSDKKLVGEYRGRGIMQVYNLAIHGFLEDGEEPPAPIPASSAADPKAKSAPPKKDDKKGGKGAAPAAVEGVEIIFECRIDETAMIIPSEWRSRLPYSFDATFAVDALDDSTPPPQESVHTILPVSPMFVWQMDVLAGTINGSRHDTSDLEEFASIKNTWEDAEEGRAAKAAAALALFQERRRIKQGGLSAELGVDQQPSGEEKAGEQSEDNVSETVIGLLATALEKEADEVRITEAIMAKGKYQEHVEVALDRSPVVLTEEELEAARLKRAEQQALSEEFAKTGVETFVAFNEKVRRNTSVRIAGLLETAKVSQEAAAEHWKAREDYRAFANEKNETLLWLLNRTSESVEKVIQEEDPAAAAAAAKAKGAKKK